MAVIVCESRADWLVERQNSLGASDIPILFGESPYSGATLLKLYRDKTVPLEEEDGGLEPEWMEWGHRLEPLIAQKFCHVTGHELYDPGEYTIYRNDHTPWLHATPDFFLEECEKYDGPGLLQIKAPGAHFMSKWEEGPPLGVDIQVQAEMHSTGCSWGAIAALIGGQKFRFVMCQHNPRFIATMIKRSREFWDAFVLAGVEPELVADDIDLINSIFPEHTKGLTIEASEPMVRHATEWDIIDADCKLAEKARDYHAAKMKKFMGPAEILELPDGSAFSWKSQKVAAEKKPRAAFTKRPFLRKKAKKS